MNGGSEVTSTRRRMLATAVYLALAFTGCSEFSIPTRPNFGYIRVLVEATGGDLDVNGYRLLVGGQIAVIGSNVTQQSFYVAAGTHTVTLESIADNCTLQGANPRSVSVEVGVITDVKFEIACLATGIAVTTRTTGPDAPNTLSLVVGGQIAVPVSSNGSHMAGRLAAGSYTLTLFVPAHCTVSGGGQVVVTVASKTVTPASFDVTCVPVPRLEKIAFVDQRTPSTLGLGEVMVVTLDGLAPLTLGGGSSPTWAPDGTKLAFSTSWCFEEYYYYTWSCRGGLTLFDPETKNFTTPLAALAAFNPSWSPNGAAIAFDHYVGSDSTTKVLRVAHLASSSVSTLVITGTESEEQPSWSPDGQRLAFVCHWGANADLCTVNADGTALVRLTEDALVDLHPKWSPDGSRIAFARHPAGRTDPASGEIVLIDVVTRQRTVLTKGAEPAWSRDGSRLVFAGIDGLFIIGADGANLTRLTTGWHRAPAWRP